jgi:hypothetical protein
MRKFFDKSPAIDAASSLRLVSVIQSHDEQYTAAEEEILRAGVSHFAAFDSQKGKTLKLPSLLTKAEIAFETNSSIACGWARTTVRAR